MSDTDLLRELHEAYVWEVNAAVGEDRMDLVWQLADEYTDRALALITTMESPGCGRPGCVICTRPAGTPAETPAETPAGTPAGAPAETSSETSAEPARHRWPWRPRRRHAA